MSLLKKIFAKKSRSNEDGIFFGKIERILGFKPLELSYYEKAFTHRSSNILDEVGNPLNYERLEFLGDAMLSAVIAGHLFNKAPTGDEGYLTKMRSKIVSREHLNELGKDLNLVQFVESKDRSHVDYLLSSMKNYIDIIIPRGGKNLVKKVLKKSVISTIGHFEGVCHVYVDREADLSMAIKIVKNRLQHVDDYKNPLPYAELRRERFRIDF